MSRPLRIAFGRIAQETNSLSRAMTTMEDFERTHLVDADRLLRICGPDGDEAPGFMRNAELSGFVKAARELGGDRVELVPLFSAWAIPGGPLTAATLDHLRQRLVRELQAAGPLDGLFLCIHGAMGAEGTTDPEALILADARRILGPDAPIAASLDLHAHLSRAKMQTTHLFASYRTNPHRDHARVGYRLGSILVDALLGRCKPVAAWRSLPMVLGGGTTVDLLPTMGRVYRRLKALERDPRVLYISLLSCHLWNDAPDLGWAVHVLTDDDQGLAERLADEVAELAWGVRDVPPPHFPSATEALEMARKARLRRKLGTVCICDVSDVVGAGAPGENTQLLRVLLLQGQGLLSYAPIRDAAAVGRLWGAAVGEDVTESLGGHFHPELNEPLQVSAKVRRKEQTDAFGRVVVLDTGHLVLVVTEGAPLVMKPAFYSDLGLSPWKADICVVKSLFPFRLYFAPMSRLTIYAQTKGVTDLDAVTRLQFEGPVHPVVKLQDWRDGDRRRRVDGPAVG